MGTTHGDYERLMNSFDEVCREHGRIDTKIRKVLGSTMGFTAVLMIYLTDIDINMLAKSSICLFMIANTLWILEE